MMADRDHWAKVRIADEKRAASIWKFFVYDDQGELRLGPNSLSFKGAARFIEIPLTEVHGIEFHRQTWAWALSASIIGVVCLIYVLHGFATRQVHSAFVPAIAIFGSLLLLGLLAYNTYSAPWIVLTCRKNGEPLKIWFAVSRCESAAGFDETMALRDAIAEAAGIDARPF